MGPIIGITAYAAQADWKGWSAPAALLPWAYVDAIRRNGGRPVLLPPGGSDDEAAATVSDLDGIVLAGGADVNPARYGAQPHPATAVSDPDRDAWELAVAKAALRDGVPLLGICRGMQVLNVCLGGTLHQHVPDLTGHDGHDGPRSGFSRHRVRITAGQRLASILPSGGYFDVPTHHHQAVDVTGPAWCRWPGPRMASSRRSKARPANLTASWSGSSGIQSRAMTPGCSRHCWPPRKPAAPARDTGRNSSPEPEPAEPEPAFQHHGWPIAGVIAPAVGHRWRWRRRGGGRAAGGGGPAAAAARANPYR